MLENNEFFIFGYKKWNAHFLYTFPKISFLFFCPSIHVQSPLKIYEKKLVQICIHKPNSNGLYM